MLKKTVTYVDLNGKEVSEDLYFHFNKMELLRLAAKYGGDLNAYIDRVVAKQDPAEMFSFLEDLILSSYGVRSDDGRRFNKNPKTREDFEWSIAYAELFESLIGNPQEAQAFGKGVIKTLGDHKQPETAVNVFAE